MKKERDYKQVYDEFWKDIVEKDGVLDADQVKRELSDYSFMLEEVPKVYCEVTRWKISKPNTYAFEVIDEFNESYWYKETIQDDLADLLKSKPTKQEIVDFLNDYFEL